MQKRNLTQADLARLSNLSRQVISRYINQDRTNPDPDALAAIAIALKLPFEVVYSAANIPTTPMTPREARLLELEFIYANATDEQRADLLRYARYIASDYHPAPSPSASKTNPTTKPKPRTSQGSA